MTMNVFQFNLLLSNLLVAVAECLPLCTGGSEQTQGACFNGLAQAGSQWRQGLMPVTKAAVEGQDQQDLQSWTLWRIGSLQHSGAQAHWGPPTRRRSRENFFL